MYDKFGLFINGQWTAALDNKTAPVFSPVSERPLGQVPLASVADTEAAIASAAAGFAAWKAKTAFERADALHAIADEMKRRMDEAAQMISLETGKPIAQAGREWVLSIDQFRWFAEEARRRRGDGGFGIGDAGDGHLPQGPLRNRAEDRRGAAIQRRRPAPVDEKSEPVIHLSHPHCCGPQGPGHRFRRGLRQNLDATIIAEDCCCQ